MSQTQNQLSGSPRPVGPRDDDSKNSLLNESIQKASAALLNCQHPDGYWWFTLEANETINSEKIFLLHYMNLILPGSEAAQLEQGLARHIHQSQNKDGSWGIYYGAPGDLSTTIECYLALKMAGYDIQSDSLQKAQNFILKNGGLTKCRIFTRIHLAMFGIIPWSQCPSMPVSFILFPNFQPLNIYEFSSWARATIVPLLIILDKQIVQDVGSNYLNELYSESDPKLVKWSYNKVHFFSLENFFLQADKVLKLLEHLHIKPLRKMALKACEKWIREHAERTEDIYPAMAYAAIALYALGYDPETDPTIIKCLNGLKAFQTLGTENNQSLLSIPDKTASQSTYQQCCVSPVWDTPWAAVALLEANDASIKQSLIETSKWLVSKQICDVYGDWSVKNKTGKPGGWSFEFKNDYFPDVDDTIEVLLFLKQLGVDDGESIKSQSLGLDWLLSMQCKNGGWAAFDVDNTKNWVNKIPFSDHAACQDPPTPDITGRTLELLAAYGYTTESPIVQRAIAFLEKTQEHNGSWEGRWGVNYLYGTWCALQGLKAIGYDMESLKIKRAIKWLKSVQNADGGFGESCLSYDRKTYIAYDSSVPSQTAWALMGLVAGDPKSPETAKAAEFLTSKQNEEGRWEEREHTGTGFPGHFYIRYHGYRYYFPLLALAKYKKTLQA